MGLCRVFQHAQASSACDVEYRIEIRRLAVKVHREDDTGAWGYRSLDPIWIEIESALDRFDRNRRSTAMTDRKPSGYVGVRRNDHLVAWPDVHCTQGQVQGVETIGKTDGMRGIAIGSVVGLETLDLRAEDVPTR